MEYGYARVSTKEQHEERQLIALAAFGICLLYTSPSPRDA